MTETKKRTKKAQETPGPKKRTRETNPIYQGTYTIRDYLRDTRKGNYTPEKVEFIQRFSILAPEEIERLEAIDRQAKDQYDGPESWDAGDLWDIPEYLPRNISALDYYRTFYELDDTLAVSKRLEQIRAMARYMEAQNIVFWVLQNTLIQKYPEFEKAVKKRTALIEKTRLGVTKESEELTEASRRLNWAVFNNPQALDGLRGFFQDEERTEAEEEEGLNALDSQIREFIETLGKEARTLELFATLSYEELAEDGTLSKALAILKEKLPEDVFKSEFDAFRLAHPGEGYRDAITRILKGMIWNLGYSEKPTDGMIPEDPRILRAQCESAMTMALAIQRELKDDLESYREYIRGDSKNRKKRTEPKDKPRPSTLIHSRTHPTPERNNAIVSHGPVSNEITRKNPNPNRVQLRLNAEGNEERIFKVIQDRKTSTIVTGHIDTVGGVKLNTRHQTIMGALASVLVDKTPDAFFNGSWDAEADILETELIARCYGIDKRNVTQEYKEQFRADMLTLKGSLYTGNWAEYMEENPTFRRTIEKAFPNCNGRVKISLIDYDMYETTDAQGNSSWHYRITRFPILDFIDINTGMASKLRYTIKEAPVIPWDSVPEKIRASMEELATHKTPTIKLYQEKDGKRYIPALQTREKSVFMDCILRELETKNRYSWIENTRFFDLDLNGIYEDVWGDLGDISNKTKIMRKTALVSYIYRLWINQETGKEETDTAQVYGVTILTTGPGWNWARVYLREPLEPIPAIMKDPEIREKDRKKKSQKKGRGGGRFTFPYPWLRRYSRNSQAYP